MKEQEYTGNASEFRKSEFIDATEDLAGRTRLNPVEMTVEKAVICSDVTNKDGVKENGVFALALTGAKRRLRVNATKRKLLIAATGTGKAKDWSGVKVRLYQTVDSDRLTGGKTATNATAIDAQTKDGQWLRYYDFQQTKGRQHVEAAGLLEDGRA